MKLRESKDLWYKFICGSDDALSKLYNRFVHELYSYGLKIHGDDDLVKDCIQEVFINLIDKRKELIISDAIDLYLFKSLRNKLLEELRSRNRRTDIAKSIAFGVDDQEYSIEKSIIKSEEERFRGNRMTEAMNSLSDYQKEAIYLKYSQGFEYEKIAELLDIDVSSARTLIYRSLKKMKDSLCTKAQILFFFFRSFSG